MVSHQQKHYLGEDVWNFFQAFFSAHPNQVVRDLQMVHYIALIYQV